MLAISRLPSESAPARIAPLAVLPVFFGLAGRRVVVAGGSDGAAWKAELLLATGAQVHLFAPMVELGEEWERLLGEDRLIRHDRAWDPGSFAGAALVVADAESDAEAAALQAAARAAGVPINIIDRPAFCDFQFGSIVNRSPVVVGISTDGAAPILGQAIRRKIETVLPPSLATWAALAQRLRGVLAERLAPGAGRRTFWERFVDRAFGPAPGEGAETALSAEISGIAADLPTTGRVTLVGAGPGDADLLTLRAVRALQAADVILFDDLVSDEVLELARREAKRILVGKRAGRPSCRQGDIDALMVKLAKAGRHVVRLKSGDPSIFGRAGEEMERLRAEGIAVEMVPGITAALAMAAALGVSLTHRDCAKSVRLVTGHSRHGGLPEDLDWRSVADPSATTIFYMAGRTAAEIAERLVRHGIDAATPIAIAASLGRREQRLWRGRLDGLAAAPLSQAGPVVIGVGAVFAERQAVAEQDCDIGPFGSRAWVSARLAVAG